MSDNLINPARIRIHYRDPALCGKEYEADVRRLNEIIDRVGFKGWRFDFGHAGGCILEMSGPLVPALRRELETAIQAEGLRVWIED
jgi:hypothetical protein